MAREGLNKVILIGNLGMDPELQFTQGGQARLRLRLATSETYVDRGGERQEKTEWHTIIIWGKRAEALNNILSKGRSICVEGSIEYRQWEDREGQKRNSTQIRARNIILLGGGRGGGGGDFGGDDDFGGGGGGGGYGGGGGGGGYGGGGGGNRGGGGYGGGGGGGGGDDFGGDFGDDDIPF